MASKTKAKSDHVKQLEAIGVHMVSQEFAMSCLLETIAKRQPALAEGVAQAMRDSLAVHPTIDDYPGLRERIGLYLAMIETQLAKKPQ